MPALLKTLQAIICHTPDSIKAQQLRYSLYSWSVPSASTWRQLLTSSGMIHRTIAPFLLTAGAPHVVDHGKAIIWIIAVDNDQQFSKR